MDEPQPPANCHTVVREDDDACHPFRRFGRLPPPSLTCSLPRRAALKARVTRYLVGDFSRDRFSGHRWNKHRALLPDGIWESSEIQLRIVAGHLVLETVLRQVGCLTVSRQ
ncbi:MAG: hypothetical protein CMJ81_20675 [Planctomycetaceae bacterium]|nr:hypothetical protein [Planctomycetaceae bacterium]